ncbi:GGDEF domain-containing protein [Sesbania bispinosa]|nr:GGDEF domain-containing protein [Sesbania bispinosa]
MKVGVHVRWWIGHKGEAVMLSRVSRRGKQEGRRSRAGDKDSGRPWWSLLFFSSLCL